MAATLLAEGTSTTTNCPDILDVPLMAEVLRGLGATVELDGDVARITSPDEPKYDADFAAVRQFRASVCVLGPLVGRCKRAKSRCPAVTRSVRVPWTCTRLGCGNWARRATSSTAVWSRTQIHCAARRFSWNSFRGGHREHPDGRGPGRGCHHDSQRGARTRRGRSVHDAEPDGRQGRRRGFADHNDHRGTRLYPTEHRVIGDRIVAATWGIAAAITRGDITVTGVDPAHLQVVLHKLHDAGATVTQTDSSFRISQYERPRLSTSQRCLSRDFRPTCSRWRSPWRRSPTAHR